MVMVVVVALSTGSVIADDESQPEPSSQAVEQPATPKQVRERRWKLRFFGALAGDNGGVVVTSGSPYSGVSINGGGGVGVNFEYRTSPRMGFEIGAMAVGGDVRVGVGREYRRHGSTVEVSGYVPVTFALNYHPLENSELVDLYVGPLAASTFFSSTGVGPGVMVESRVDFGLGANLGVDINFSRRSRWSFNSGFKYIANVSNGGDRDTWWDFDPLIFSFGFGFKF